ncbi:MAG: helix-turn-helix transcriptional regulator, partial [Oscillospiraceae bacterium]|nr:helix-turn-helix transcriptional regulator [Oscillospiraceae bacterium]
MNINLGEKLKSLRKEKNVSQEKLAQYLNVSFQAVSKWENASTYPDIELLPEIARFFGITVD